MLRRCICSSGEEYWHKESSGEEYWYKEGKFHRDAGPAVIHPDGTQYWFKNGKYHREDGPAIIRPDGRRGWYKEGVEYEPSAHELMVWKMNERRNIERTTH